MQIQKKTKYLLTTTEDNCIAIAEVPSNYIYNQKSEYVVSESFINTNLEVGNFIDVTGRIDWDGQIWLYAPDIQ